MTYIFNSSFLRGLGIGLIISGLVLSISKTSFLDRETAPVQPTNTSNTKTANTTANTTTNTMANTAANTPKSTAASTAANTGPADTSTKPNPGAGPGVTKPDVNPPTTGVAANPANSKAAAKPEADVVTFVVPKGSNSSKIAGLLLNAGLIKDKAKFETVVNKMNLARRFKAGNFTIPKGASEVDIVLALTK